MPDVVLSKELMLALARDRAADRFRFLAPVRLALRIGPRDEACSSCGQAKPLGREPLSDDLYRAVLRSSAFSAEAADLADWLRADRLHVPGAAEPVRSRAR